MQMYFDSRLDFTTGMRYFTLQALMLLSVILKSHHSDGVGQEGEPA